jgi:hypothetical protein
MECVPTSASCTGDDGQEAAGGGWMLILREKIQQVMGEVSQSEFKETFFRLHK